MFNAVHDHFASTIQRDAEMLYVVGLMALLAPYLLGDEATWTSRSELYRAARLRLPETLAPSVFEGRGAYGEYFAGQSSVAGGY